MEIGFVDQITSLMRCFFEPKMEPEMDSTRQKIVPKVWCHGVSRVAFQKSPPVAQCRRSRETILDNFWEGTDQSLPPFITLTSPVQGEVRVCLFAQCRGQSGMSPLIYEDSEPWPENRPGKHGLTDGSWVDMD